MTRIIIFTLLVFFPLCYIQAQENSLKGENPPARHTNNLTPEQIREFRDRMCDMLRNDFANLEKYKTENENTALPANDENRVVFFGNSITEWWEPYWNTQFPNNAFLNRGIAGQTTAQMLIRFKPDVINLNPKVVVILAGINDITGMMGQTTNEMIADNISSMIDIAKANGVKVILSSVLPCYSIVGRPDLHPAERVVKLNDWLRQYARHNDCMYLDYFTPLADKNNGLKKEYTDDGVHPNKIGYEIMAPLVKEAIQEVLGDNK